ncbi:hypothetical protein POM88_008918 [Heracleum sosnowskyi]|uniref:Ubiquitin-like protease family profile domain-containing protein n=1 Tax=Heracleum sosnowskyi TaxID=360622 RepID=A0AAD8JAQ7_9APIA|nr:hypothetical protein POM88_008918 [Heracleum sosnowskyi]
MIIYSYMGLLREREEDIHNGNIWERKPVYYFMDPYFIVLGKEQMKKLRKATMKGEDEETNAWHAALRFFNGFACATIGPSVMEADYMFIPCCVGNAHWVLFMFSTKNFNAIILDSLNDEPDYQEDIQGVSWLLPRLLLKLNPQNKLDPSLVEIMALPSRPKQKNCNDCGIFVMKYMDLMFQGYDLTSIQAWSQELVDTFRYRIATELQKGKARGISCIRMRKRHESTEEK